MDQFGWIITGVPHVITYTVGLIDLKNQQPELAVHGLNPEQAFGILSAAVTQIMEKKYVYRPGLHYNVVENLPVKLIEVSPSNFHDWFGQAAQYHGSDLKMLQILWCDPAGRFPGDPYYDLRFDSQKRFDVRRPDYPDEDYCSCGSIN